MEETNDGSIKNLIKQTKSVESSDLDDEISKDGVLEGEGTRLCLVGEASTDSGAVKSAEEFGVEVVVSEDGSQWKDATPFSITFILSEFEGPVFDSLHKLGHRLVGTTALKELAARKEKLPLNTRPLYSLAMWNLYVCFTGFRKKEELGRLIMKIHYMGGHIRKQPDSKVTHLVAQRCGGDKYQYAMAFRVPIVGASWVYDAWAMRSQSDYCAADPTIIASHKLKPFQGARVCFVGFPEEEQKHMAEVLVENGGTQTDHEDAQCTHMVLENDVTYELLKTGAWLPHSPQPPVTPCHPVPSLPSTSTPQVNHLDNNNCDKLDDSPIKHEISLMDISPEHPFHKELDQIKIELFRSSHEKIGKRLSLTPIDSPRFLKSPLTNVKNRTDLTPIQETSPLQVTHKMVCAKKELSFSDHDECASPKFEAKRRKTMSPTELNQNRKVKKSPKEGLKKFTHSSLRKSFKMKTHSLARWISSSDVCVKASPRKVIKTDMPPPSTPTPAKPYDDLLHHSPPPCSSLGHSTLQDDSHRMLMVVDESTVSSVPPQVPSQAHIVKAEWFWASVQNEGCVEEKEHLFEDYLESLVSPSRRTTPVTVGTRAARKRKRLQEAVTRIASGSHVSPATTKRRSSVSDAGLLSVSGSFLDCTTSPATHISDGEGESLSGESSLSLKNLSPRHQVFLELVQTECNYVNTLKTIMTLYKDPLEKMVESDEQPLLNPTELKIIFGNLPPIYQTHCQMLEQLRWASAHWTEDISIGNIILKFSDDLVKAYPPYVNFYETTRELLIKCDQTMPRFHAFLKIGQTKPECGRQSLLDLLIRPIQRLPSINLLLTDILKHTNKINPDHSALQAAVESIKEVTKHINEDKRRTEAQMVMFGIFNNIENCPADLVSSHRRFITRCDVMELSDGPLSGRGDALAFFLFSDTVEVCKKRSKANSLKSPNTTKLNSNSAGKSFKHVKLMPLSHIKRVIDITETEECRNVFALMCKSNQELKEKLYSFTITDEKTEKTVFLKTLCRQMANTLCRPDAENFLATLDPEQLDIDTSDIGSGTLSKAFKFASRTRMRVGRVLSFNKTPSKLKRAMSTMMSGVSPFGSTTNLTPASQLAQMRLASCNNLNELGSATPTSTPQYTAPMSVQPTRRNKHSSLSVASLRRL